MATTSISITPQFGNNIVTAINCGTSVPRLGGTVDISAFPSLTSFICNSNDITALSGYAQNSNLTNVQFFDNKVTGSIPSLSGLTSLQYFYCQTNQLTGPIPSLNGLTNLQDFRCLGNQLTGPIPSLSGLTSLQVFYCQFNQLTGPIPSFSGTTFRQFQGMGNQFTGSIPSLSGLTNLTNYQINGNSLTGSIPSLSGLTGLGNFDVSQNFLTGQIPSLSGNPNLRVFWCYTQKGVGGVRLTGPIPSLSGNPLLQDFLCFSNQLTGPIPSLSGNPVLSRFWCDFNQLTGFAGGSVFNTLGSFSAANNQLNQSSVNAILSAFVVANRTTGTRVLSLGGSGNAAPSYTGGVTTTSPGTNFTRSGTLVTVTDNITPHGHVTGDIVTITDIGPTTPSPAPFQGTFVVTRITDNQFQYNTLSSGTVTGTGTATMRKTSDATSGYASYQNLALVSRTGGPWTITINQP